MYKACIFDLDGTLTDTLDSLWYSVNETLKQLGVKMISTEQCPCFDCAVAGRRICGRWGQLSGGMCPSGNWRCGT